MTDLLTPLQVEGLARKAGLSMAEVCRRALINGSTFRRWKMGATQPRTQTYSRIISVLREASEKPVQQ